MKINNFEYSIGNKKIGRDTLIFNMGSAKECPSKKLGLCKVTAKCYALKAEQQYQSVRTYRANQAKYWLDTNMYNKCIDITKALSKHKKIKYVRINESGDFYTNEDIRQVYSIAAENPDVTFYLYTHRVDLIENCTGYINKCKAMGIINVVISISNTKIEGFNEFKAVNKKTFDSLPDNALKCGGDCSECGICKTNHNKTCYVCEH